MTSDDWRNQMEVSVFEVLPEVCPKIHDLDFDKGA